MNTFGIVYIVIIAIIVIIVIINICLWCFFIPWLVDKKIRRYQNELMDKHYDEVETMYRKMRGWRHDYHNHIQVLKAHMEFKRYEEACAYLNMLEQDLQTVDSVLKTGNVMVDAILNSKLAMMRERDILVDATAIVPQDVPFSGIDLSVLRGRGICNGGNAAFANRVGTSIAIHACRVTIHAGMAFYFLECDSVIL